MDMNVPASGVRAAPERRQCFVVYQDQGNTHWIGCLTRTMALASAVCIRRQGFRVHVIDPIYEPEDVIGLAPRTGADGGSDHAQR